MRSKVFESTRTGSGLLIPLAPFSRQGRFSRHGRITPRYPVRSPFAPAKTSGWGKDHAGRLPVRQELAVRGACDARVTCGHAAAAIEHRSLCTDLAGVSQDRPDEVEGRLERRVALTLGERGVHGGP